MSLVIDAIAIHIKQNPQMSDIDLKHSIENKWPGIDVQWHRNAEQTCTVLYLHNEQQDNVLLAMIDRNTVL